MSRPRKYSSEEIIATGREIAKSKQVEFNTVTAFSIQKEIGGAPKVIRGSGILILKRLGQRKMKILG